MSKRGSKNAINFAGQNWGLGRINLGKKKKRKSTNSKEHKPQTKSVSKSNKHNAKTIRKVRTLSDLLTNEIIEKLKNLYKG